MKVSTKTRYGLRAVIYLAERGDEICPLKQIAQAQEISFDYLEKIMAELREAGIVKSHQGSKGGYTLNRKPTDIRVGEVIRALEGTNLIKCLSEEGNCSQSEDCLAKEVWRKLQVKLNEALNSITLKDLIT